MLFRSVYYGGTIAAPVIRGLFENILPYLGIEPEETLEEPENEVIAHKEGTGE